jgi:hypothetical protein
MLDCPVENGFLNPDPEVVRQAENDGLAIAIAVEEEEEPDVYDVELKMYDPDAKPPFHKNRRFRVYSFLIFLLAIGGVILAAVLPSQSKNKNKTNFVYITTAPPTPAPTTTRDFQVRSEIARVVGDIVNEPNTIYDDAMRWLLYEDPMFLDEFSENLVQRYVLVLFYFKTSQEGEWISCNPPKEGGNDTSCTFNEYVQEEDSPGSGNFVEYWLPREEPSTRWLSNTSECEWAQVTCHPSSTGTVRIIDISKFFLVLYILFPSVTGLICFF